MCRAILLMQVVWSQLMMHKLCTMCLLILTSWVVVKKFLIRKMLSDNGKLVEFACDLEFSLLLG